MKFIPPLEISSKIMTLIEEAEEELILVSPYLQITKWIKMKNCLERAVKRNVNVTLYVREDLVQDYSFINQIGIKLVLVKYLHAKLYLNEKRGIVTSQNIIQFSDINSIDVGYETEKSSERKELVDFVNKSIRNVKTTKNDLIPEKIEDKKEVEKAVLNEIELEYLNNFLEKKFPYSKFKQTSTYIFCSDILYFADVMIDNELTIKIRKSRNNCDEIVHKLEKININNFKIQVLSTHKIFYYLTFVPDDKIKFNKVVEDFVEIIKTVAKF